MKILKFNEGFFGKYDVDITEKKNKDGFVRYPDDDRFEIGEVIRVKNGFKIKNVIITDIEERQVSIIHLYMFIINFLKILLMMIN
jgi:hypothetical protein